MLRNVFGCVGAFPCAGFFFSSSYRLRQCVRLETIERGAIFDACTYTRQPCRERVNSEKRYVTLYTCNLMLYISHHALLKRCPIRPDAKAHRIRPSTRTQLPFIWSQVPGFIVYAQTTKIEVVSLTSFLKPRISQNIAFVQYKNTANVT